MENYNETLNEMLELAGCPILEKEDDMGTEVPETDLEGGVETDEMPPEEDKKEKEDKGEINDEWETDINSRGKFKIEFYNNFIYAYYKNRRSQRINIDPKLKPYKKLLSEFINKIFDHIEKKS